jgi:hypothetical protein
LAFQSGNNASELQTNLLVLRIYFRVNYLFVVNIILLVREDGVLFEFELLDPFCRGLEVSRRSEMSFTLLHKDFEVARANFLLQTSNDSQSKLQSFNNPS